MKNQQQSPAASTNPTELAGEVKHELHSDRQKMRKPPRESAQDITSHSKEKRASQAHTHNNATRPTVRDDRESSYAETLDHMRKELPRPTRTFSKFIHHRLIEQASEIIASTIARPNAILAGGVTAFLATLALYSYARFAGFSLQGSETIIAFLIGWTAGLLYDLIRAAFFKNRQEQ